MVFLREGCEVPRLEPMFAKLNGLNCFYLRSIEEFLLKFLIPAQILVVDHVRILLLLKFFLIYFLFLSVDLFLIVYAYVLLGDPAL